MTPTTPTGWDLLDTARSALRHAAAGLADDDSRPTPCADWTVTQVLQHAAGDQLAWATSISGSAPPADNPFAPSGHLGATPVTVVDGALSASAPAWASASADAEQMPTPLPQGPVAPDLAAAACALDAAVHAWDIAVATGQESPLSEEVARQLAPAARQIVEPLRGFAYAVALDPRPDDDETAALLRYLGRDPNWVSP
jgi:uncharacterized protein (TIGR03086 family)